MPNLKGLWGLSRDYFESADAQLLQFSPSAEEVQAFIQRTSRRRDDGPGFTAADGVAHIPVIGALTKEPDFFFDLFGPGNAVYGDIIQALAAADADPEVERIILEIDSPGGDVLGMVDTAHAISSTSKPIEAQITDLGASVAFLLASQADRIVTNNSMALVGSVGILTTRFVSENRVTITSTEAPDKAPDASTDEGVAAIRRSLDPMHAEMVSLIAAGRTRATGKTVTAADVNRDFGRGAALVAKDALAAGMIDAIVPAPAPEGAAASTSTETNAMTLEELKSKHPALYAEIFKAGQEDARSHVLAHLAHGEAIGGKGLEIAAGFIVEGTLYGNPLVAAKYAVAGANTQAADDRTADDTDVNTGVGPKDEGARDEEADQAAIWKGVRGAFTI